MSDDILRLYDTFLARFSFFRQHIKLVVALDKRIAELEEWSAHQADQLNMLKEKYLELGDKCDELEKALERKPKKAETSRDLVRTSQDIMQSIYSNYYVTGEALPDRQ